jgi:hypothetical protein
MAYCSAGVILQISAGSSLTNKAVWPLFYGLAGLKTRRPSLRKAPVLIKCNNQPYQKETVNKLIRGSKLEQELAKKNRVNTVNWLKKSLMSAGNQLIWGVRRGMMKHAMGILMAGHSGMKSVWFWCFATAEQVGYGGNQLYRITRNESLH